MLPVDPPSGVDELPAGSSPGLGKKPAQRFDYRRHRDAIQIAEIAEGVIGLPADPDVDIAALHHLYSYPSAQDDQPTGTSWLQHLHPDAMLGTARGAVLDPHALWTSAHAHSGGQTMARPTGEQAIAAFCRYQRKRNLSESTIRHRRFRLNALARAIDPTDLLDVTPAQIDRWLDKHNPPKGLSPQTRYTYVSLLAAFYTWAQKERLIRKDPTEDLIRPKLPKRMPRPWNPAEVAGAIMLADERMTCWLLLAWFAGCRVMEMAALRVEEIHGGRILLHGKGDKERSVPLHPVVQRALNAYGLPRAGYVFRRRDGGPLKPSTISRYVGKYLRSVGVDATAHQGRHRYATDLAEISGGDLLLIAELLGHSSTGTAMLYTQLARGRANDVVGQMSLPEHQAAVAD